MTTFLPYTQKQDSVQFLPLKTKIKHGQLLEEIIE